MKRFLVPVACLLLSSAFTPAGRASMTRGDGFTSAMPQEADFSSRILTVHNVARAEVGEGPMRWNAQLAADADEWARHLAATREFDHADQEDEGENLFMGTRGHFPVDRMVAYWRQEKVDYTPGTPIDDDDSFEKYGHFTQMVWRDTHEVGCAVERNASDDYLVCRYAEPGNLVGERPY